MYIYKQPRPAIVVGALAALAPKTYKSSSNRSCAKKRIHHHKKIMTMQHNDDNFIEYLVGGVDIAARE
jgi:hypothetical protein